jgi:hypothetical protein
MSILWESPGLRAAPAWILTRAGRLEAVKTVSMVTLLTAAGLLYYLTPYTMLVRVLVAIGAFAVMYHLFDAQRDAFGPVSGGLVPPYDPAPPEPQLPMGLQCLVIFPSAFLLGAPINWRNVSRRAMTEASAMASRVLPSLLVLGVMAGVTSAGDFSRYRHFELGTDLATIAKEAGVSLTDVKVIHRRPALIQELAWRPQPFGPSSESEPVKDVVFTFYNGELLRIVINYDRYATEGLTADDFIEGISANYGSSLKSTVPAFVLPRSSGDEEQVVARWQDPVYRFDLLRSTYWPSYKLVGVVTRLEAPAQAAITEALRLDDKEAPQRDAERLSKEKESEQTKLDKARIVNKPKFRP